MRDYDSQDTVFYIDPPYLNTDPSTYKHKMTLESHKELLSFVMDCQGFCAISGYANPLYDSLVWDARHTWEAFVSIQSIGGKGDHRKEHMAGIEQRGNSEEVLWIKE
jgi:DNA adenine methylase